MPARRLTVSPQGKGLAIITTNLPFGLRSVPYSAPVIAVGGTGSLTWSITFQTGGNGWVIDPATGVVSGTPGAVGINSLFVSVFDGLLNVYTAFVSLQIGVLADAPVFSPVAGTYPVAQSVAISTITPGGVIWLTVDGSTPTFPVTGTTVSYSGPIPVSASLTINALTSAPGFINSAVVSSAYVISASPAVVTNGLIKFMPGHTMSAGFNGGTVNYVDGANNYPVSADVNAALSVCFRANHTNVRGFFPWFRAPALETTQGHYLFDGSATDPILSAYKAVQAEYRRALGGVADQGIFGFGIASGANTSASNNTPALIAGFTFNGSAGPAAPWIRDCVINGNSETYNGHTVGFIDVFNTVGATLQANGPTIWTPGGATTRYPLAIQAGASQQCGYGYAGWNSVAANTFATIYPTTWEIGHGKARQNFWKALSQFYKLPFTDASGTTTWFTLNDHPRVGLIWNLDETSPGFQVGTKPISSDAINYPNGNFLSATGYWAERFDWMSIVSAAAPKLQIGDSWNFLFQTGAGDDDTHSSYNARYATISSQWKNMVLIGPDTYSGAFSTTWSATDAQQNYIGVVPSAATPGTVNPALSFQGKMGNWAQVQDLDWSHHVAGGSGNFYSVTCGQGIITAANGHSNTIGQITMCSGNIMWYFRSDQSLNTDFPNFIYPSFSGTFGQFTTPVYAQRVLNFMAPVTINSVAPTGAAQLTIQYTPFTLDAAETGLTYTLFENGVSVITGNTSGTFVRNGLAAATPFSYTIAMANANGTGPQGAAVVGEVGGTNQLLILFPQTMPAGGVAIPYGPFTLTAVGGSGTYNAWSVVGATWLSIDSSGNLIGSPTVAGTYNPVMYVYDTAGNFGTETFTCTVS